MKIDDQDPIVKAFCSDAMHTEFTASELFDALYWYRAGWEARPANSYDKENLHVSGISAPMPTTAEERQARRGNISKARSLAWTPAARKKRARTIAAKKKRFQSKG